MGQLDGKSAVVTGAGSGIGRAIAMRFAAEGACVLVADTSGTGQDVADAIGGQAVAARVDVSKEDEVARMVELALARFGRLDIIVNNAGIEGEQALTADCTLENFDRVIAVNLRGVFLGMKYALPAMLAAGGGSIINMASTAGLVGSPGLAAYCASKAGVIQLTKTAALEYAKQGVRVNAICPGVIWTPMTERSLGTRDEAKAAAMSTEPVGRLGTTDEVAALALYLAGDGSRFVTGTALPVDGGVTAG